MDWFFAPQDQMWDDYSASDEKIHNFFEILPNTLDNIRQGYSGINSHLTDTQHLYSFLSQGNMSVSDTALSADLNNL